MDFCICIEANSHEVDLSLNNLQVLHADHIFELI